MNPFMTRSMITVPLFAALVVLPSCSEKPPKPTVEQSVTASYRTGVPGGIAVATTTLTANVVAVHHSTRELVLDDPDGRRFTAVCRPEVTNFDQIRAGDQVRVTVTEEVAVSMASESDRPDTGGVTTVELAPEGGRPGAVLAKARQVTATVTAIDAGHHTATLQFPDGQTRTIAVRHDVDLSQRKVGEKVVIRKTDSIALRVEKPQRQ